MAKYIINKEQQPESAGGNYEVHNEDTCLHLPHENNRIFLDYFTNCKDALDEAKNKFPQKAPKIDGCYYCLNVCYKS